VTASRYALLLLLSGVSLAGLGCHAPGKPGPEPEVPRPDQVVDFPTLYRQNCLACHGNTQLASAAIPLANPVYLAFAGEANLKNVIANGVPGKLMPPFAQSSGGMLTDQQIEVLAQGLIQVWGKPQAVGGQTPPPYAATLHADAAAGQQAYATFCARCHGASGEGGTKPVVGSIVDSSYLALISDQGLRSIIVAGVPGMPDWRSDNPGHPLTDQELTNIVGWLGSHRTSVATESRPPQAGMTANPASPTNRKQAEATKQPAKSAQQESPR
jgi:mono/diheme cytochrome c family protein